MILCHYCTHWIIHLCYWYESLLARIMERILLRKSDVWQFQRCMSIVFKRVPCFKIEQTLTWSRTCLNRSLLSTKILNWSISTATHQHLSNLMCRFEINALFQLTRGSLRGVSGGGTLIIALIQLFGTIMRYSKLSIN